MDPNNTTETLPADNTPPQETTPPVEKPPVDPAPPAEKPPVEKPPATEKPPAEKPPVEKPPAQETKPAPEYKAPNKLEAPEEPYLGDEERINILKMSKELQLNQDQAQKVHDLVEKTVENYIGKGQEHLADLSVQQEAELKRDKELGGLNYAKTQDLSEKPTIWLIKREPCKKSSRKTTSLIIGKLSGS